MDVIDAFNRLERIVARLIEAKHLELPKWRIDGGEVETPEEVAAILGIPYSEAKARMAEEGLLRKDVHAGMGAHPVRVGIGTVAKRGTVYQRACAIAYKKRKRRRKKEQE